jgi:hypothetical protein
VNREHPQGVALKFARARVHLDELDAQLREYLDSEQFAVMEQEDASTGDLLTRVHVARQPPAEMSVVIGDVVHNARSALDHLAWHLVERDGGSPDKHTYFPAGETKSNFASAVKDSLRHASAVTRDRVRALAVHPGGDEDLWLLHQLDIEDKHRLLIPVGMAYKSFNLHMTFRGFGDGPVVMPPISLVPADRSYPLSEGDIIFRVAKAARESTDDPFKSQYSFSFDLAFGGSSLVAAGKPIKPTLPDLVAHAEQQALALT